MFINETGIIGSLIGSATVNFTGSLFITLIIIMIIIMAMAFLFQIPLEWTAIVILPLLFAYMSQEGEFIAVGVVVLIYLALIFTKRFFIR